MYKYRTLENVELQQIYEAFLEAFSDYMVQIDMPFWKFQSKLRMDGFRPELSMGAFKDEKLVGLILNGVREWNGKLTAYDGGTGVAPECRKQGITTAMFGECCNILKENKIEQYLLEVIKGNEPAVNLYKNSGFEITRELNCYRAEKKDINLEDLNDLYDIKIIDDIRTVNWNSLQELREYDPTWQNSLSSIMAVADMFIGVLAECQGEIIGYGIVNKKSGGIAQLVVKDGHWDAGAGSMLLGEITDNTEDERLGIINVDSKAKNTNDFLIEYGFGNIAGQYEMLLKL